VTQHPDLAPLLPEMVRQLKQLSDCPDYHEMMYSRKTTPITFALFDRFEEMHAIRHVLHSYRPNSGGSTDGENQ
jgi:hypothetical protein